MNRDGLPELLNGLPGPDWATETDRWEFTDRSHAWRTHSHTIAESEWTYVSAEESYDGRKTVMGEASIDVFGTELTAGQARALAAELTEAAALADWINDEEGDAA